MNSIVIMGVAGCGKSSLATLVARAGSLTLIEGDDYHSVSNREKMQQGIALTDADRDGWLTALGETLQANPRGMVVTCSALKRAYRQRLRDAAPGLGFVFLEISKAAAQSRVCARAPEHFFSTTLVDNQFETLEAPTTEDRVLTLDAQQPLPELQRQVADWLAEMEDTV